MVDHVSDKTGFALHDCDEHNIDFMERNGMLFCPKCDDEETELLLNKWREGKNTDGGVVRGIPAYKRGATITTKSSRL